MSLIEVIDTYTLYAPNSDCYFCAFSNCESRY